MTNYYNQYIKSKEIIKDINYFHNKMKDLICNDIFGKYLYNKRKKLKIENYTVENFLSTENKTRLKFSNDKIIITFKVSKIEKSKSSFFPLSSILPSVDDKNILYKDQKIDGLTFYIDVVITPTEEKSKMIYSNNEALREVRHHITLINDYYIKNFRKEEESKNKIIYNKIISLKASYYNDWNRLIEFIKNCIDPEFYNNLNMFKDIINGFNSNKLNILFKMMHHTRFFQKYAHSRQIKYHKFIKSIRKECLDENEILELSNELASCFGHSNKNYNECLLFIENLINHYNLVCHAKEKDINSFVSNTWKH
jgi:hypothetical protein